MVNAKTLTSEHNLGKTNWRFKTHLLSFGLGCRGFKVGVLYGLLMELPPISAKLKNVPKPSHQTLKWEIYSYLFYKASFHTATHVLAILEAPNG